MNRNRRTILQFFPAGCLVAWAFSLTESVCAGQIAESESAPPLPPGAVSLESLKQSCTACQLCVSQCPTGVLRPAFFENGLRGFMQPVLKYELHHFCDYECRKCIEVCPAKALGSLSLPEKKLTRIGRVKLVEQQCIVIKDGKACGACAEHCPTGSLRMVPHKPALTKPEIVDKDACIGCGGCESILPSPKGRGLGGSA